MSSCPHTMYCKYIKVDAYIILGLHYLFMNYWLENIWDVIFFDFINKKKIGFVLNIFLYLINQTAQKNFTILEIEWVS